MFDCTFGMNITDAASPQEAAELFMATLRTGACELYVEVAGPDGQPVTIQLNPDRNGVMKAVA